MTVSSSVGRQFTIDQLVTLAYKNAGLLELSQPATPEMLDYGRDRLEVLLDRMPNDGPAARVQDFLEVPLVADQFAYTMETRVLDFLDPAMLIRVGEPLDRAQGEELVSLIDQRTWQSLSAKGARGSPNQFYPHRTGDQIEVRLWPIPDTTGETIRFRIHRALADVEDGTATLDLEPYWNEYVVLKLGALLCSAQSVDNKAAMLESQAQAEFWRARGQANHRGPERMGFGHWTGWEGR